VFGTEADDLLTYSMEHGVFSNFIMTSLLREYLEMIFLWLVLKQMTYLLTPWSRFRLEKLTSKLCS
jgi:hypothetical protein